MLADDDPFITALYRDKLTRAGHRVKTVKDGEEAVKSLQEAAPDLLVLDLNMPRMDGTAVLRYIREQSETPGLPVIVLSNACARDFIEKVNLLKPTRFLIKYDHTPNKVFDQIQEVLSEIRVQGFATARPVEEQQADPGDAPASVPELLDALAGGGDTEWLRNILLRIYRDVQEPLQALKQAPPLTLAHQYGEAIEQLLEQAYAHPETLAGSLPHTLRRVLPSLETWVQRVHEGPASPELVVIQAGDPEIRDRVRKACDRTGFFPVAVEREATGEEILAHNHHRLVVWSARRASGARKTVKRLREHHRDRTVRVLLLMPDQEAVEWNNEAQDAGAVALAESAVVPEILAQLYAWCA
jgi:CheY-like chemotaxis protein